MPLLDEGHFQCLEAVACMFHSLEQAGPGGVSGAMHGGMELVNDCSHGHECCNGFLPDVLWLHHCMDEISQWWKQGQYLGCHGTKLVAGPVMGELLHRLQNAFGLQRLVEQQRVGTPCKARGHLPSAEIAGRHGCLPGMQSGITG